MQTADVGGVGLVANACRFSTTEAEEAGTTYARIVGIGLDRSLGVWPVTTDTDALGDTSSGGAADSHCGWVWNHTAWGWREHCKVKVECTTLETFEGWRVEP